jgi:hypothetical protein
MEKEHILKKYYREINLTKMRMKFYSSRLTNEEISSLEYRIDPRNKVEQALKEDIIAFIRQLNLEGKNLLEAKEIALMCGNEALNKLKNELSKERKCKF